MFPSLLGCSGSSAIKHTFSIPLRLHESIRTPPRGFSSYITEEMRSNGGAFTRKRGLFITAGSFRSKPEETFTKLLLSQQKSGNHDDKQLFSVLLLDTMHLSVRCVCRVTAACENTIKVVLRP